MVKGIGNNTIKFQVNREQFARINLTAQNRGYKSIAAFMRDLALKRTDFIDSKILEISYDIKKILEVIKHEKS